MEATLAIRSRVAMVRITCPTKSIRIRYVDSTNRDYEVKRGVRRIHGNYLKWVDNVVHDISIQMQATELDLENVAGTSSRA